MAEPDTAASASKLGAASALGGWSVHHLAEVGSTNDVARDLYREGASAGTVVRADVQTGGRGRRGRAWASPAGNIYMTAVIAPERPTAEWPLLSLIAATSLADALLKTSGDALTGRIGIKWPNDVLIEGRKISGILLETELIEGRLVAMVGIGVNIASHPDGTRFGATHLDAEAPGHAGIGGVFQALLEAFAAHLEIWERDGPGGALATWRRHGLWLGERVAIDTGEATVQGTFEGITDAGLLRLRSDAGDESVHAAGDVSLTGPSAPGEADVPRAVGG